MKKTLLFLSLTLGLFAASGCEIARPASGPGLDGKDIITDAESVVVVGTLLVVDDENDEAQERFDEHVQAVTEYLETEPVGFLGSSLRTRIGGNKNWTMTLWESEEDMMAFVVSDAHLAAMSSFSEISQEGKTVRFEQDPAEGVPEWDDILARLDAEASIY